LSNLSVSGSITRDKVLKLAEFNPGFIEKEDGMTNPREEG